MTIDKKYSQNIVNVDKSHKHKYTTNIPKIVFGFAIFVLIFIIAIPILLLKNKKYKPDTLCYFLVKCFKIS